MKGRSTSVGGGWSARRDYLWLLGFLFLGFVAWFNKIGLHDLNDALAGEALFGRESIRAIFFNTKWHDQMPLYFLFLHFWQFLGQSPFVIRTLNVVIQSLSIFMVYKCAMHLFRSSKVSLGASLLAAVSVLSYWGVREGRMYPLYSLLTLASAYWAFRYFEERKTRCLIFLGMVLVLNIHTHFFGFFIAAIVFIYLIVRTAAEAFYTFRKKRHTNNILKPFIPLGILFAVVSFLSLYQIVRAHALLSRVPTFSPEWSLGPGVLTYLSQVASFSLRAPWGIEVGYDPFLTVALYASIVILFVLGMLSLPPKTGLSLAFFAIFPILALAPFTSTLDLRDRYFVVIVPFVYLGLSYGALGDLSFFNRPLSVPGLNVLRHAVFVVLVLANVFFLYSCLDLKNVEWSRVMVAFDKIFRKPISLYITRGYVRTVPQYVVDWKGLDPALGDIKVMYGSQRGEFQNEVQEGRNIAFLDQHGYLPDEYKRRVDYLRQNGYKNAVLYGWGAMVEYWSKEEVQGLFRQDRLGPAPEGAEIVKWARARLLQRIPPADIGNYLGGALVARVHEDGNVIESLMRSTQNGTECHWWAGNALWQSVREEVHTSAKVKKQMIWAHPLSESILVLAFPAIQMKNSLRFTYGIADSGLWDEEGADVRMQIFINSAKVSDLTCPNMAGWKEVSIDTRKYKEQSPDLTVLISTRRDEARHFCFNFESSGRLKEGDYHNPKARRTIKLTNDKILSDSIEYLNVYRLIPNGSRIPSLEFDDATLTAHDMHERALLADEGGLFGRWVIGRYHWDSVGFTAQRFRDGLVGGIWAHPREGTTLVIEAKQVVLDTHLRVYYGLTDYAAERSKALGLKAPVHFRILIDGGEVYNTKVPRVWGLKSFSLSTAEFEGGVHALRVEVESEDDSWAHFVFDLEGTSE